MSETKTINPQIVGKVFTSDEVFQVGRERIREFARAVKATHPIHFEVDAAHAAGYSDVVAPPTFAIILAQRADAALIEDPDSGIDFSRVVHADQRFTHHRPIVAGDELTTEVHVDNVRTMGSGAMLITREEITTVGGEAVATCVSSLLVRGED